jgi:hypothetical protein
MTKVHATWETSAVKFDANSPEDPRNFYTKLAEGVVSKFGLDADDHLIRIENFLGNPIVDMNFCFPSFESAEKARPYFDQLCNKYSKSQFYATVALDIYSLSSHTPLLKYVSYVCQHPASRVWISEHRKLADIINGCREIRPIKKALWQCQKEMIDAGYEGNATW